MDVDCTWFASKHEHLSPKKTMGLTTIFAGPNCHLSPMGPQPPQHQPPACRGELVLPGQATRSFSKTRGFDLLTGSRIISGYMINDGYIMIVNDGD